MQSSKTWAFYLDILADFIFLTDIFVTCFSAYYDERQGVLVTTNKKIMSKYLKSWFFIDLVASMPVSLIEDSL